MLKVIIRISVGKSRPNLMGGAERGGVVTYITPEKGVYMNLEKNVHVPVFREHR